MAVIGSTILLTGRTHLAFRPFGLLPRTYVSSPSLWFGLVFKGYRIFLTLPWLPSGARPDLSPEDEEVKRKLVKCAPRAYSELIRSDIPGLSDARPAQLPFLRPSPLSVMKPSLPPCLQVLFIFCFGAFYCEAYSGRASGPPGGAGQEEKEREAEILGFP